MMYRNKQGEFVSCFVYPYDIAVNKKLYLQRITSEKIETVPALNYTEKEIWDPEYDDIPFNEFKYMVLKLHKNKDEEKLK